MSLTEVAIEEYTQFNRGPVTSLFVPANSCTETLTRLPNSEYLYAGHAWNNVYFDTACFPMPEKETQIKDLNWSNYYFSPAICPHGWTTATTLSDKAMGNDRYVTIDAETTAVICCPNEYKYTMHGHVCASKITQSQVVSFIRPVPQGTDYDGDEPHGSTFMKGFWAYAHGYQAWHQSSDQAVLAAAATATPTSSILQNTLASPGSSTGAIASNTASPPADDDETSSTEVATDSPSRSGLSVGAKAGIGVAVGVAALAAMILAFVLYRRSRRRKGTEVYRHELPSDPPPIERKSYIPEMMAEQRPVEAHGNEARHELPGSMWKH